MKILSTILSPTCIFAETFEFCPTIRDSPIRRGVISQIAQTNFTSDISYSLNFGIALKMQFPHLRNACSDIGFISDVLEYCLGRRTEEEREITPAAVATPSTTSSSATLNRLKNFLSMTGFVGIHEKNSLLPIQSSLNLLRLFWRVARNTGTCSAISYRYKSSTTASMHAYMDGGNFQPIANRIRDISITRSGCTEETILSLMSIARSWGQIGGNIRPVLELTDRLTRGEVLEILMGSRDILVVLQSIPQYGGATNVEFSGERITGKAPVFGFDCHETCLVENIVAEFDRATTVLVASPRSYWRKSFMYLQSINSNWLPYLSDKWGRRITESLVGLRRRSLSDGASIFTDSRCVDPEFVTFVNEYIANSDSGESTAMALAQGIEMIVKSNSQCSVYIATGMALVFDAFLYMVNQNTTPNFVNVFIEYDLSMLMEMQWQTIAGDKFENLVLHELPIFELMLKSWTRIPQINHVHARN